MKAAIKRWWWLAPAALVIGVINGMGDAAGRAHENEPLLTTLLTVAVVACALAALTMGEALRRTLQREARAQDRAEAAERDRREFATVTMEWSQSVMEAGKVDLLIEALDKIIQRGGTGGTTAAKRVGDLLVQAGADEWREKT